MSLPWNVNASMGGAGVNDSILRALRFRNSASTYLNRTFASTGNQQKFTYSLWFKRGALSSTSIASSGWSGSGATQGGAEFWFVGDQLSFDQQTNNAYDWRLYTTQVLRDPSAWYHVLVAVDTTQATSSNRVLMYLNGVQITAFSTATYPALNATTKFNATNQRIGSVDNGGSPYLTFDGYMAEYYFIDGQQLTPASFGYNDPVTGVWQPAPFKGTYGTNGFYLPFTDVATTSGSNFGLGRDYSGNGNYWNTNNISVTTGTGKYLGNISGALDLSSGGPPSSMVKGSISAPSVYPAAGTTVTFTPYAPIPFTTSARVYVGIDLNGPSTGLVVNTTNFGAGGVANNNNGWVTVTSALSPITTMSWTRASAGSLGMRVFAIEIDGVIITDNVISAPTYDSMIDSPTNFSDGTAYNRGNYCTLNPLDKGGGSSSSFFLAANLNFGDTTDGASANGDNAGFRSTIGVSSGKWYIEGTKLNATTNQRGFGFGTPTIALGTWNGGPTNNLTTSTDQFIGMDPNTATAFIKTGSNAATTVASSIATYQNTVYGIALDLDNLQVSFYVNGAQVGSTTSFTKPTADATYFVTFSQQSTWNRPGWALNFGQRPFYYTPPSGYKALNTFNLPTPTIGNGAAYMAATLYTGNGGTQSINNGTNTTIGTAFQPDFIWMKSRNNTYSNLLFDSVRGGTKRLISNLTDAEATVSGGVNSFDSNGMTIQNDASLANLNASGTTYVGWQWQAGKGTTSSNTSGSITSTVSVNATAGFSVVTYTGTGANATVGHGLGVAPSMIIVKNRSTAQNWSVYHVSTGNTGGMTLNTTDAFNTGATYWNSTTPTSTVFTVGTGTTVNQSTSNMVAYCFAAVRGYSAFGSYTGNGSTDGPFVFTGFRPRWLLIKRSSSTADWILHDTSRSPYNLTTTAQTLAPNLSDAEGSASFANDDFDMLSNGFKIRNTGGAINFNGDTYIYAAFAENPFNYSRAR